MLPGLVGELLLAFLLFAWEARAQTRFDFPGPQISPGDYSYAINFPYGEPQTFRWTTNLSAVRIQLNQETVFIDNYEGDWQQTLAMNNGDNFYQWSGIPSPEQNLRQGIVFFLQLFDAASAVGSSDPLATSNYFNITDIPTSSSSSAPASTSTRASSTSTLPTAPTSATTSTETSSSATSSATETSTPQPEDNSLAIGLGVGLGCALLLALLAAGFFYRRYRKRRSAAGRTQDLQAGREFDRGPYPFHGQDDGARYSELSGPDSSFQLHSDSVLPPPPQEKDGRSVQRIRPELE